MGARASSPSRAAERGKRDLADDLIIQAIEPVITDLIDGEGDVRETVAGSRSHLLHTSPRDSGQQIILPFWFSAIPCATSSLPSKRRRRR